jgi:hypothetical protein
MIVEYVKNLGLLRMSCSSHPLDFNNPYVKVTDMSTFLKLSRSTEWYKKPYISNNSDDIYTMYVEGTIVVDLFNELLEDAQKKEMKPDTSKFKTTAIDLKATFPANVKGTSILFRKGDKIYIAKRSKNQKVSIDCIPIDDVKREEFFADTKASPLFKGKYLIDAKDEKRYKKWDSFMHNQFVILYVKNERDHQVQLEYTVK